MKFYNNGNTGNIQEIEIILPEEYKDNRINYYYPEGIKPRFFSKKIYYFSYNTPGFESPILYFETIQELIKKLEDNGVRNIVPSKNNIVYIQGSINIKTKDGLRYTKTFDTEELLVDYLENLSKKIESHNFITFESQELIDIPKLIYVIKERIN